MTMSGDGKQRSNDPESQSDSSRYIDGVHKKTQGPPCLSANPKPGVRQLNYATGEEFEAFALEALDELAALVRSGGLRATVDRSFSLEDAALAFNYSAGSGAGGVSDHVGKISITVS